MMAVREVDCAGRRYIMVVRDAVVEDLNGAAQVYGLFVDSTMEME